jgi:peptide chain release factor 3
VSDDPKEIDKFVAKSRSSIAIDLDGDHVYMAPSAFYLDLAVERNPAIRFVDIKTSTAK